MEMYYDYAIEQIVSLCKIPSPTGYTNKVIDYLKTEFDNLGLDFKITNKGAFVSDLGGEGNPLLLAAHIDTLGAMVRSIKSNGKIRLTKIGGYPENNIEGENCIIHTRDGKEYTGTIQLTHPSTHVYKDIRTMERNDENIEVVIDEKVYNKDDVEKLGIRTGDFISLDARTVYTESGFIKSRHLDDKASAGILMSLARMVKEGKVKLKRKVYIMFTSYEEVGHGGSAGIPKDIDEMISVDMGAIGDDLNCSEYQVSICAKDSGGPYDYNVTTSLIDIAGYNNIDHAVDIYPMYGSDVEATLRAGYDIKHGLIGPGVFASHGYERTHKEAVKNTIDLIYNYISE
ncbi:MAG: M42 family metallopeptidase [Thermotogota bacterium]